MVNENLKDETFEIMKELFSISKVQLDQLAIVVGVKVETLQRIKNSRINNILITAEENETLEKFVKLEVLPIPDELADNQLAITSKKLIRKVEDFKLNNKLSYKDLEDIIGIGQRTILAMIKNDTGVYWQNIKKENLIMLHELNERHIFDENNRTMFLNDFQKKVIITDEQIDLLRIVAEFASNRMVIYRYTSIPKYIFSLIEKGMLVELTKKQANKLNRISKLKKSVIIEQIDKLNQEEKIKERKYPESKTIKTGYIKMLEQKEREFVAKNKLENVRKTSFKKGVKYSITLGHKAELQKIKAEFVKDYDRFVLFQSDFYQFAVNKGSILDGESRVKILND